MSNRRLPVYLIVDCSESMIGPTLDSVSRGIKALINELCGNPHALETVWVGLITFSREAKLVVPLTEVLSFQLPKLSARPGTALGAALRLLLDCLDQDVIKPDESMKGDYKPLVFLLTDGQPTDEWEATADALKSIKNLRLANLCAIGCGPDVDLNVLKRTTDSVLMMRDFSSDAIQKLFVWVSASVQAASTRLQIGPDADSLLPLPSDTLEEVPSSIPQKNKIPSQVFLHAYCSKLGQPYLMRYALNPDRVMYDPVASHPLDYSDKTEAERLPPVKSSVINGAPPCPYCENPSAGMCQCGTLLCVPDKLSSPLKCPGCGQYLSSSTRDPFEIKHFEG